MKSWDELKTMILKYGWCLDHDNGETGAAFKIRDPSSGHMLTVIASWALGWDHVSVSTTSRTPSWREMQWIKDLFFGPDEPAMQLHPPAKDYINHHPYCLHLWRPLDTEIPLPPTNLVGPRQGEGR